MKPLNYRDLIKILKKHGFVLSRKKGSHMIWKDSETNRIVPIPLHGGSAPIPQGTFLAIIKQSGIAKEEFEK